MELEIFPIGADYIVIDGKPVVRLFGIAEKGERKILYDDSFEPYCYISASKERVKQMTEGMSFVARIEETEKIVHPFI